MRYSLRLRVAVTFVLLLVLMLGGMGLILSEFISNQIIETTRSQLLAENRLVASEVAETWQAQGGRERLNQLANKYAAIFKARVTFIDLQGTVVGESQYDSALMEPHDNRPEVLKALAGGEGSEIRYSQTLKQNMMYVAVPIQLSGKVVGVSRLSLSMSAVQSHLTSAQNTILLVTLAGIFLAIVLAILLTDRTTRPLRGLTQTVLQMSAGEGGQIRVSDRVDEVQQLDEAFHRLSGQLNAQIAALSNERGTLTAVLGSMADGVLIVDEQGKVRLINQAARRLFNVAAGSGEGAALIEVVRHHQLVELWRKCELTREQQMVTLETTLERLFIQGIATPLSPEIPGSTLLIFQDLTRIRRLESVRRDFVSNVSHELRTPLASLKALTETLQEGALEDPPAARRFLLRMDDEIDNLTQLVHELLELSRIESGKVPLEQRATRPEELLGLVAERMQIQAARVGLALRVECPADLPPVNADRSRIEQVLVNLVHNAIKFTPKGEIFLSAYRESRMVVFLVRDTGVGITAEDLSRIFERFFKADRSRSGGGTGLGLSIARHMIEAHGGRIWAESTPGQGSTFFFSLPVA